MRSWRLWLFDREVLKLELHEDPITVTIEEGEEEEPPETLVWGSD